MATPVKSAGTHGYPMVRVAESPADPCLDRSRPWNTKTDAAAIAYRIQLEKITEVNNSS
jgi:hypothetical protein